MQKLLDLPQYNTGDKLTAADFNKLVRTLNSGEFDILVRSIQASPSNGRVKVYKFEVSRNKRSKKITLNFNISGQTLSSNPDSHE